MVDLSGPFCCQGTERSPRAWQAGDAVLKLMFPHQFLLFPFHVFTTTEMFPLWLATLVFSSVDSPSFLPFCGIVLILPALKEVGMVNQVQFPALFLSSFLPPLPAVTVTGEGHWVHSHIFHHGEHPGNHGANLAGTLAASPQCPILRLIGELDTYCVLLPLIPLNGWMFSISNVHFRCVS